MKPYAAAGRATQKRYARVYQVGTQRRSEPHFVVADELLRKGRLDEIFFVDLPSREERLEIFRIHVTKRGRDAAQFDLGALADASTNFSGAEIEEAINSALYDAFYSQAQLTTEHVLTALGQTVPLAKTMDEIAALQSRIPDRKVLLSMAANAKEYGV